MQVVRRMPPVLVRGEGTRVFDNDGKSYLDFTGRLGGAKHRPLAPQGDGGDT